MKKAIEELFDKTYKIVIAVIVCIFVSGCMWYGILMNGHTYFDELGMHDAADEYVKFIYKLDKKYYKIEYRVAKYWLDGNYEKSFELMDFVWEINEERDIHNKNEVYMYIDCGVYVGEYEKVVNVFECLKADKIEIEGEDIDRILSLSTLKLLFTIREIPDSDDRFKYYAIDLFDYQIKLCENDESKKERIEGLRELKSEVEAMLKK